VRCNHSSRCPPWIHAAAILPHATRLCNAARARPVNVFGALMQQAGHLFGHEGRKTPRSAPAARCRQSGRLRCLKTPQAWTKKTNCDAVFECWVTSMHRARIAACTLSIPLPRSCAPCRQACVLRPVAGLAWIVPASAPAFPGTWKIAHYGTVPHVPTPVVAFLNEAPPTSPCHDESDHSICGVCWDLCLGHELKPVAAVRLQRNSSRVGT
jgi:hypothetical protein